MASAGAKMDYDFGPKRNWRRWAWNRIAEEAGDGVVIYLPGATDFDRQIALSKGFAPADLIGVERDKAAAVAAKQRGAPVVSGDFFDAVDGISLNSRVSVVFADLCGGLTKSVVLRMAAWMQNPNMFHTVFAVNLLRGREVGFDDWRKLATVVGGDDGKHRGMHLHSLLMFAFLDQVKLCDAEFPGSCTYEEAMESLSAFHAAEFNTYKSRPTGNHVVQVFDSAVFRNPWSSVFHEPLDCANEYARMLRSSDRFKHAKAKKARLSAAAVMAHRTMRENRIGIYK
jgi:hypothetical protein